MYVGYDEYLLVGHIGRCERANGLALGEKKNRRKWMFPHGVLREFVNAEKRGAAVEDT